MGARVWLDDERPIPKEYDLHAKTAQEAIDFLKDGKVSEISFDHDLGETEETGYFVAKWIEEQAYFGKLKPVKWRIHSANPSGRERIRMAMLNADKFWTQREWP